MKSNSPMEYRLLGPTGLKVSIVGLGTNNFKDLANQQFANDVVKAAIDLGINLFDTAESYGGGNSEIMLGKAIKANNIKREDIVVITKLFWGTVGGVNAKGLSRKKILESIKNSLKDLDMEYVDIVFAHRYDHQTPLEEVCRAFHTVIEKGWALYWGTSEWTALQIASAIKLCTQLGLHKPVVEQPQYNMLHRQRFEVEYAPLYDEYKYGTTIWSPLAAGLLTGKYIKDIDAPGKLQGYAQYNKDLVEWSNYMAPEKIEGTRKMFEGLEHVAKEVGGSVTQLALAWTLRNKDVSTSIMAVSKVEQVEDNVKAVAIYQKFTPEIDEKIEKILGNRPETAFDFKEKVGFPPRR